MKAATGIVEFARRPLPDEEPCGFSIEQQILDFLDGRNDGAPLFDALYGDTLSELLPAQLTQLLASWRTN